MATAARRTTAATPAPAQPARRSTRASIAAATRVHVPPAKVVQAPIGPAIKLTNAVAAKDPRFTKTMEKLQKSAAKTKEHAPAARKAAEAQAASVPPANEKLAGAKAQQVYAMKEAETKKPESNSFIAMLRAEIDKVMPKTLGETDEFMKGSKKQQLKGAAASNVNQQKNEAAGDIKAASDAPPDPSKVEGKEVTPLPPTEVPAPVPAVGAAEAMPAPKSDTEVSLQKSKQEANNELTQANVTPEQLRKANDPRFSAVLTAKSAVDKQADSAPQKYRVGEQQTLTQAAAKAVTDEKQGLTALQGQKGKAGVAVKLRQVSAKEKDEAARKKVTDDIEKIYNETKQTVETKLASLETDVSTLFDQSIDAAMQHMTAYIDDRMFQWKLKRYLSIPIIGLGLWIKDKLLGLPAEVNAFYEEGRKLFVNELDAAIIRIAGVVEARLKEAKDEIAKGQQRISDYVKNLAPELQAFGKAAEKDMASRFDELRQSVDDKKNDLAQKLAQRYKDAYDKAGEKLKEMQAENKGLVTALKEKLGEILKVLREFKERIMGLLKKSQDAINLIVADPIGFLKNLLNAIKKGISQFVDNIWTHLKAGFLAWLFGSLAEAGIVVPQDFSLPSILKLVLQVLGLTYDRIRAKAVKLIGERNVMLLEKAWELISALITGGPAALWEKIKEFLGNLKEMIISAIQDWVVTAVIKAAVTKLISMFNPVGAIIQAILAIYNTVMFFIERINQILALVEAIINSVYKIATGDIGSAANWIEQALARTIPVIIGFLARLLGLSGITEKIKGFILKIQNTVDKAIDKVIDKIVKGIGKLFGKGKGDDVAKHEGKEVTQAEEFDAGGEHHRMWVETVDGQPKVMIASAVEPIKVFIKQKIESQLSKPRIRESIEPQRLSDLETRLGEVKQLAEKVQSVPTDQKTVLLHQLVSQIRELISLLPTLTVGKGRNIAIAYYNINGKSETLVTLSNDPGDRLRPFTPGENVFFRTFLHKGQPRHADTEVKILEYVKHKFAPQQRVMDGVPEMSPQPQVKGEVHLASDFLICGSCAHVIGQFRRLFPNVTLVPVSVELPEEKSSK